MKKYEGKTPETMREALMSLMNQESVTSDGLPQA